MIPRPPERPAIPGVIVQQGPAARLKDLLRRYRWELLPAAAGTILGGVVEIQAATDTGLGTAAPYIVTCLITGPVSYGLTAKTEYQGMAFTAGFASAFTGWAAFQTGTGPGLSGLVLLALITGGSYIPYGKYMAERRDKAAQREAEVRIAQYSAMEAAYAGSGAIPGQREKPAIETIAAEPAGRVPGQMPVVPWPGAPAGLSIKDPIRLSDNTEITLPGVHVLVAGGTDMGKSGILHIICCNTIARRDAQLYVIDMKPSAIELGIYRLAGARVATTPDEALAMLRHISAEAARRGERMGANVADDGSVTLTTSWEPTPDDPQMVLVIDELAELTAACPEAADELRSHTRLLRAFGATTVAGSQITSANTMGGSTDARGQFGLRISVPMFEAGQINMAFGQGAQRAGVRPDLLRAPGEFVLVGRGGHDGKTPDRAYLMTNQAIADHVRRHSRGAALLDPETEPEAFTAPAKPGRIDNATELITDYLREHGWSTAEDVTKGLGYYPDKLKSFRNLMRRHADNGLYKRDKDGTRYAVNDRKTLSGNVVRFPGRSNA